MAPIGYMGFDSRGPCVPRTSLLAGGGPFRNVMAGASAFDSARAVIEKRNGRNKFENAKYEINQKKLGKQDAGGDDGHTNPGHL